MVAMAAQHGKPLLLIRSFLRMLLELEKPAGNGRAKARSNRTVEREGNR